MIDRDAKIATLSRLGKTRACACGLDDVRPKCFLSCTEDHLANASPLCSRQAFVSILAIACWLTNSLSGATTIVNQPSTIAEQVERADYVVRAVVAATELIEVSVSGKRRDCGVIYSARIVEQFRGSLPALVKFTAYPMPRTTNLTVGDEALLLLRDAKNHPDDGFLADLALSPSIECRSRLPTIYTPAGVESVFRIDQLELAKPQKWLFFGELTSMPEIGVEIVPKRCLGTCDNCEMSEPARVAWESLRPWIVKWSVRH